MNALCRKIEKYSHQVNWLMWWSVTFSVKAVLKILGQLDQIARSSESSNRWNSERLKYQPEAPISTKNNSTLENTVILKMVNPVRFNCSKLTKETREQGVKYVQS